MQPAVQLYVLTVNHCKSCFGTDVDQFLFLKSLENLPVFRDCLVLF